MFSCGVLAVQKRKPRFRFFTFSVRNAEVHFALYGEFERGTTISFITAPPWQSNRRIYNSSPIRYKTGTLAAEVLQNTKIAFPRWAGIVFFTLAQRGNANLARRTTPNARSRFETARFTAEVLKKRKIAFPRWAGAFPSSRSTQSGSAICNFCNTSRARVIFFRSRMKQPPRDLCSGFQVI